MNCDLLPVTGGLGGDGVNRWWNRYGISVPPHPSRLPLKGRRRCFRVHAIALDRPQRPKPGCAARIFHLFALQEPSWKPNASTRCQPYRRLPVCEQLRRIFDYDGKRKSSPNESVLEDRNSGTHADAPRPWDARRKSLETVVGTLSGVSSRLADARDLFELARKKKTRHPDGSRKRSRSDRKPGRRPRVPPHVQQSGDPNNCFIDIQAGAGGTKPATGLRCCCASI